LRTFLREKPEDATPLKQEAEWEWAASQHAQFSVRILDEHGQPIVETPGMAEELAADVFPTATPIDAEPVQGTEVHSASGKSYRLLAARAALGRSSGAARVIQVALDRTYEDHLLAGYRRSLWIVLGTALLACAVVGHRIARRGLRPVAEITDMARH